MFGIDDLVGGVVSGFVGDFFKGQDESRQQELSDQSWRMRQSNAHQLEVEDLRNAGLNPILSATNGGNMAGSASVSSSAGSDVSSAAQVGIARKQNAIAQQNANTEQQNAKTNAENAKTNAMNAQTQSDIGKSTIAKNQADSSFALGQLANNNALTAQQISNMKREQDNKDLVARAQAENLANTGSAALQNAGSQSIMARVAEANGISLRDLNAKQKEELQQRINITANEKSIYLSPQGDSAGKVDWYVNTISRAIKPFTDLIKFGRG